TALDQCAERLAPVLPRPLLDVVFGTAGEPSTIDQTLYTQPALFAVGHALCAQWRAWGVIPNVVMGHSVGEYGAACAAGVLGPQAALDVVAARGRLMQSLPAGGAMAAIYAPLERV